MQGTAHAAKEKPEEQPAQSTAPQRAEQGHGKQVPVKTEKSIEEIMEVLKSPTSQALSDAINFLKGRMKPDKEDETYAALKGIIPDKDFMSFKKGAVVFAIPPEGSKEADIFWEAYNKESAKADEDRSFIRLQVYEKEGIVIATNILYMPPEMQKVAPSIADSMEKILATADEGLIAKALGAYTTMQEAFAAGERNAAEWRQGYYETRLAQFNRNATRYCAVSEGFQRVSKTISLAEKAYGQYNELGAEYAKQLSSLAETGEIPESSGRKVESAKYWLAHTEEQLSEAKWLMLLHKLSGVDARERIDAGISWGLYSSPEEALYKQIAGELDSLLSKMKAPGAESKKVSTDMEKALSLVAVLEALAWKTDLEHYRSGLLAAPEKHGGLELKPAEELKRLAAKADAYCGYMKNLIEGAPLLQKEERKEFLDAIDSARDSIKKATTLDALSAASASLKNMGEGAAVALSERYEMSRAENPKNPWSVRTAEYAKMYALRYSVPLIIGTTVIGGAAGSIAGGPGGILGGAETGYNVGGAIVGSAAIFVSAEALSRYFTSEGYEADRAIEDLRAGAALMMFAAGGGPMKALAKPLSTIVLSATAASSLVLLQSDLRSGDSSKYMNIPSDVAFIAIGGMGFVRTFWGGFRPLNLGAGAADVFTVADSAGIASTKLSDKVSSFLARPLEAGYSPKWFAINALFGGGTRSGDIYYSLKHGNVNSALTALGKGFSEVTGQMVGFDFLLTGVGTAGKAGIRSTFGRIPREMELQSFRINVPWRDAKYVKFLEEEGLDNEIYAIVGKVKPMPLDRETAARVIEIAYGSSGKVSPAYVQKALGLEGEEGAKAAAQISKEVSKSWEEGRAAFAKKAAAGKEFWRDAEKKMEKNRALVRAASLGKKYGAEAVALGALAYIELKSAPEKALRKELSNMLTDAEGHFISASLATSLGELGFVQVDKDKLFDGASEAFSLGKRVSEGDYALSKFPEFKNEETSKRFMLACASALLMNGVPVTEKEMLSLASKLYEAMEKAGIAPAPKTPPLDGLALLASLVLNGKEEDFINAFPEIASTTEKGNEPIIFNCAVSAYYYAAISGKSVEWARDESPMIFQALMDRGMAQYYSATELALMAGQLYGEDLSTDRIWEAAGNARQRMSSIIWNMAHE